MDNTQQKSGAGAGSANGLPQPIQDGLGATILGPHNLPGDETRASWRCSAATTTPMCRSPSGWR